MEVKTRIDCEILISQSLHLAATKLAEDEVLNIFFNDIPSRPLWGEKRSEYVIVY